MHKSEELNSALSKKELATTLSEYYQATVHCIHLVKSIFTKAVLANYAIAPNQELVCTWLTFSLYKNASKELPELIKQKQEMISFVEQIQQVFDTEIMLSRLSQYLARYSISIVYDKSDNIFSSDIKINLSLPTAMPQFITDKQFDKLPIQLENKDKLLQLGYSEADIDLYKKHGADKSLFDKLLDNTLKLANNQSIECIKTFISMGSVCTQIAQGKELLLLIGNTGAGKSTIGNYLHGCKMTKQKHNIIVSPSSNIAEVMQIGHATKSKTFIPTIAYSKESALTICDCPGFDDTRGNEFNIANAVNIKRLTTASKGIKVLILISYDSLKAHRGKVITDLKQSIENLFGGVEQLCKCSDSVLVAVTKVPKEIDGHRITLEDIREDLFAGGELPISLSSKTYIIDPLDVLDTEGCLNRDSWLTKINSLPAINNPQAIFKTNFNNADSIFVMDLGKNISKEIQRYLDNSNFQAAVDLLSLLSHLRAVDHQLIDDQYKINILLLHKYLLTVEQGIFEIVDYSNLTLAQQRLAQMKQLMTQFYADLPELSTLASNLNNYIRQRKIQHHLEAIQQSVMDIVNHYDQSENNKALIACQISKIKVNKLPINTEIIDYLLKQFIAVPVINKASQRALNIIRIFVNQFSDYQTITAFNKIIASCLKDLMDLLQRAKNLQADICRMKHQEIKAAIYEALQLLPEKIIWQQNGLSLLRRLQQISDGCNITQLEHVLTDIAKDPLLTQQALLIRFYVSSINIFYDNEDQQAAFFYQLQFIKIKLFELRDKLEDINIKEQKMRQAAIEKKCMLEKRLAVTKVLLQTQLDKKAALQTKIQQMRMSQESNIKQSENAQNKAAQLAKQKMALANALLEKQRKRQEVEERKMVLSTQLNLKQQLLAAAKSHQQEHRRKLERKYAEINAQKQKVASLIQDKNKITDKYQKIQNNHKTLQEKRRLVEADIIKARSKIEQRRGELQIQKKQREAKLLQLQQRRQQQAEHKNFINNVSSRRKKLKSDIQYIKNSISQISYALRQRRISRGNAVFSVTNPHGELVELEKQLLSTLRNKSASIETIRAQERRLQSAQMIQQKLAYSLGRLGWACQQYNNSSSNNAQTDQIANDVVMAINNINLEGIDYEDNYQGHIDTTDQESHGGTGDQFEQTVDDGLDNLDISETLQNYDESTDHVISEESAELEQNQAELSSIEEQSEEIANELNEVEAEQIDIHDQVDIAEYECKELVNQAHELDELNAQIDQSVKDCETDLTMVSPETATAEENNSENILAQEDDLANQLQSLEQQSNSLVQETEENYDEAFTTELEKDTLAADINQIEDSTTETSANISEIEGELKQVTDNIQAEEPFLEPESGSTLDEVQLSSDIVNNFNNEVNEHASITELHADNKVNAEPVADEQNTEVNNEVNETTEPVEAAPEATQESAEPIADEQNNEVINNEVPESTEPVEAAPEATQESAEPIADEQNTEVINEVPEATEPVEVAPEATQESAEPIADEQNTVVNNEVPESAEPVEAAPEAIQESAEPVADEQNTEVINNEVPESTEPVEVAPEATQESAEPIADEQNTEVNNEVPESTEPVEAAPEAIQESAEPIADEQNTEVNNEVPESTEPVEAAPEAIQESAEPIADEQNTEVNNEVPESTEPVEAAPEAIQESAEPVADEQNTEVINNEVPESAELVEAAPEAAQESAEPIADEQNTEVINEVPESAEPAEAAPEAIQESAEPVADEQNTEINNELPKATESVEAVPTADGSISNSDNRSSVTEHLANAFENLKAEKYAEAGQEVIAGGKQLMSDIREEVKDLTRESVQEKFGNLKSEVTAWALQTNGLNEHAQKAKQLAQSSAFSMAKNGFNLFQNFDAISKDDNSNIDIESQANSLLSNTKEHAEDNQRNVMGFKF